MLPEDGQRVHLDVTQPDEVAQVLQWHGRSHSQVQLAGRFFPCSTRILHHFPSNSRGENGDDQEVWEATIREVKRGGWKDPYQRTK